MRGVEAARGALRADDGDGATAAIGGLPEPPAAATALADRIHRWREQNVGPYWTDTYAVDALLRYLHAAAHIPLPPPQYSRLPAPPASQ